MLKRDPAYVSARIILKDSAYYTKEAVILEFPKWYEDKGLYDISTSTYLYGIFAIIMGDKYAVSAIPTIFATDPIMVTEVDKEGIAYLQLHYAAGDKVLNSNQVIQHELLSYTFFEAYFMQAKVPWFMDYDDICKAMDHMPGYAASSLGASHISNEVVCSFIARQAKDMLSFHRQNTQTPMTYVDLMDVRYSTLSPLSKIAGNYFEEALVSALTQKATKTTDIENIVRK